jgi:hypothetical protein
MASHFVSLNRGQQGLTYSDFVTGTSSAANVGIELRLDDAAGYTKKRCTPSARCASWFF